MMGDEDDDQLEDETFGQDEDRIPGDNDKPSAEKWPGNPDAPVNLVKVPDNLLPSSKDLGGD